MSGINTRDGQSNSEKPVNLSIGDWVVVEYMHDKNRYPGQIVAFADEEPKISVQVMHRSGKFWNGLMENPMRSSIMKTTSSKR